MEPVAKVNQENEEESASKKSNSDKALREKRQMQEKRDVLIQFDADEKGIKETIIGRVVDYIKDPEQRKVGARVSVVWKDDKKLYHGVVVGLDRSRIPLYALEAELTKNDSTEERNAEEEIIETEDSEVPDPKEQPAAKHKIKKDKPPTKEKDKKKAEAPDGLKGIGGVVAELVSGKIPLVKPKSTSVQGPRKLLEPDVNATAKPNAERSDAQKKKNERMIEVIEGSNVWMGKIPLITLMKEAENDMKLKKFKNISLADRALYLLIQEYYKKSILNLTFSRKKNEFGKAKTASQQVLHTLQEYVLSKTKQMNTLSLSKIFSKVKNSCNLCRKQAEKIGCFDPVILKQKREARLAAKRLAEAETAGSIVDSDVETEYPDSDSSEKKADDEPPTKKAASTVTAEPSQEYSQQEALTTPSKGQSKDKHAPTPFNNHSPMQGSTTVKEIQPSTFLQNSPPISQPYTPPFQTNYYHNSYPHQPYNGYQQHYYGPAVMDGSTGYGVSNSVAPTLSQQPNWCFSAPWTSHHMYNENKNLQELTNMNSNMHQQRSLSSAVDCSDKQASEANGSYSHAPPVFETISNSLKEYSNYQY